MKHEDIKKVLHEPEYIGKEIVVCGWIKTVRKSKNICFIELNDGTSLKNIQLVMDNNEKVNSLRTGSSIVVEGKIVESENPNQKIEMKVENIKVIGDCPLDYPIQKKKQNMEYLREIPHLRVRTNTFNAVFKVRSVLSKAIHDYFQNNNFTYVNTPIITGSDCEGAGEMFRITTLDIDKVSKEAYNPEINKEDFFGRKASLTVSGGLEAEAMASGLGKVYTFGPAFRAENSNTKKHASEFWIVEPEIAFADLDEVKEIVNELVKFIIKRVTSECKDEIEFFNKYYDKTLIDRLYNVVESEFEVLEYTDAIKILEESKEKFEYPVYWGCDLKNEHIKYITDVVYQKPVYITNYPKDLKPFYIKVNPDGKTVASADLYFPGIGDIIGACQKEDNFELLEKRIEELHMTKDDYEWYLDLRKYGTIPHSGFGLGIERFTMYMTGMDNIRDTIPFPRTKSSKLTLK